MYGIENLKARYKMDGINVELSVDIDMDSNLPYDLANLFAKIMNIAWMFDIELPEDE